MLKLILAMSKNSSVSYIHPIEKIFLSILPIVIIGFTHNSIPVILNIIMFIFLHLICKNNKKVVIKFSSEIAAFAAISSITFVLDYGIGYCTVIILKSLSAGLCLSFFALTTPMDDVLGIMAKHNWLRDICDIAKTMERFLVVINDEYIILHNSIKSRGGFDSFKLKIRNTGKIAGLLFVNTMYRWSSIKDGIDSRGYKGYMPYLQKEFSFSYLRFGAICIYILGLAMVIYAKV